jgi:predicted RNA methylase
VRFNLRKAFLPGILLSRLCCVVEEKEHKKKLCCNVIFILFTDSYKVYGERVVTVVTVNSLYYFEQNTIIMATFPVSKLSIPSLPPSDRSLSDRTSHPAGEACQATSSGKNPGILETNRRARVARENIEVKNLLQNQQAISTAPSFTTNDNLPNIRNLQDLAGALGQLDYMFDDPNIDLEQYHTPPDLASRFLWTARNDIVGRSVADLGCGNGILGIGAKYIGADKVIGFEIDENAANKARANSKHGEFDQVIVCDVKKGITKDHYLQYDTVICNPPFGTRQKKADLKFLSTALKLSKRAVYSLHKSSTREYLLSRATRWGLEGKILAEIKYPLPKTYAMHRIDGKTNTKGIRGNDIEVCLLQLIKPENVIAAEAAANPHLINEKKEE